MKLRSKLHALLLASALFAGVAALPGRAHARFVFTLQQVGTNVVVAGSGSFNTTALTLGSSIPATVAQINSPFAVLLTGGAQVNSVQYTGGGLMGPAAFGTSGSSVITSPGSGSVVGVQGFNPSLLLPVGYASGSALTSSATFPNTTFAALGFTPGTYTYTWGTGANADSLVVTSVVPEPSTWALVGLGVGGLAVVTLRRRRAARA